MHGRVRVTERTCLTRPTDSPDYVEFASLLRTRRSRIRQFQCCICATMIAIFTMALVVTISYSVSHDTIDSVDRGRNLTSSEPRTGVNLSGAPKLGFAPGSGSYTLFSSTGNIPSAGSVVVAGGSGGSASTGLTEKEFNEGLEAGRQAIDDRLLADTAAAAFPVPSHSPESRHRYATSTCPRVGSLALAATGELAATRRIEAGRLLLGEPSAVGSFFDAGWAPRGTCEQFLPVNCTVQRYRTYDGTCNRPMHWGAAMSAYRRSLPASYGDGINSPRRALSGRELPSAREVSLKVHKPSPSSNPAFTVMLAVYGQFLDHDITATAISQGVNGSSISCCPPTSGHPECFPVPVSDGDPVFDLAQRTCMNFVRSAPAPQCLIGPRQQLNQVTAFIDGSAVYGSDFSTASELREFTGGRLKMQRTPDNRTLLPPSTNPNDGCNREAERLRGRYCFAAGDARANENLHLTTMHLLWARQHNRIAAELSAMNPGWDDETVFQESRRIVGAQLQHITYKEFLPIVLGDRETSLRGLRPLDSGHRRWAGSPEEAGNDPRIANSFAAAAFRFAHTLLPGLMMMTDAQRGTSSYVELHKMLFNPYSLYSESGVRSSVTSAARNVIQMTSTHVTSQLTNHLFEDPIGNTSVPCGLDLVSLNIQRGRDHGIPGYTGWREYCGLGKPESFADLDGHLDPEVLKEISILYESVHDVDLYTGALAEIPRTGGLVGPTFSCLIAEQFVRLQRGDRYWYELPFQPHSFTEGQLRELRKTSLSRVICDCSDGVTQIQAEVMRSVGVTNPMISCEDIPRPSFEPWREANSMPDPIAHAPLTPINWMDLKTNIQGTIRDALNLINDASPPGGPESRDFTAFRSYINNTFADLRTRLSGLRPGKPSGTFPGKSFAPEDPLITRTAGYPRGPPGVYEDWVNFKIELVKSLNNSIGTLRGDPGSAADWLAFRENVQSQFADLRNRIDGLRVELGPSLLLERYKQEKLGLYETEMMSGTLAGRNPLAMIPMIFDWKNFRDDMIRSVDDAIMSIGENMPPPGDPAWASFGYDVMNRFAELRDKINSRRTTPAPAEFADDAGNWLSFKDNIVQAMKTAVLNLKDRAQPGAGAKWPGYGDEATKTNPMADTWVFPAPESSDQMEIPRDAVLGRLTSDQVSDLTADWSEFRYRINASLSRVLEEIRCEKSSTVDPVAWAAFRAQAKNEFDSLKEELGKIRAEWQPETSNRKTPNDPVNTPVLMASMDNKNNQETYLPNSEYVKYSKVTIPPADWAAFKNQINDTLIGFLNSARDTERADFSEIQETFDKSFAELRNEIESLRGLLSDNGNADETSAWTPKKRWTQAATSWIRFRTQLNSTVNDLIENLRNQSAIRMENALKILFETRDRLLDLEPSASAISFQPADWSEYVSGINKTIADTLTKALMLRAAEPEASSSGTQDPFLHWLLLSWVAAVINIFPPTPEPEI